MTDDAWTPSDEDDPRAPPKGGKAARTDTGGAPNWAQEAWELGLREKQGGGLTKDIGNLELLLSNSEAWKGTLTFDEFSERVRWSDTVRPPEIPGMRMPSGEAQPSDTTYVHHYFAKFRNVAFARGEIWDVVEKVARQNPSHAVRDWLKSLGWDGVRRVPTWLTEYFGAADSPATRKVGEMWLVSAVARAFRPGCQVDHMLVLEGNQGLGKSRGLEDLCGAEWYLGKLPNVQDEVRAVSALRGWWIVEIGELDAFRGAAATRVKDFLTQSHDSFRAAYARLEQRRARSCVFVGSTNEQNYLTDATGARRYWPVRCGIIDRVALRKDRAQLWAEAVALYDGGVRWWPERSDTELGAALLDAQEERYAADEWEGRIATWLATQLGREGFTAAEVLSGPLGIEPGKWTRADQTRVGIALHRLGYDVRKDSSAGEHRQRRYWKRSGQSA